MSDNIKYTAEDIRRYLEGKLSPAQMHVLEKAALSDPFLADALEGMHLHGDSEKFSADVEELHTRLSARMNRRKGALASVNALWWKIAAVLFIVITGIAVIIYTGEKNKQVTTAYVKTENKQEKRQTPAPVIKQDTNDNKEITPRPAVKVQQPNVARRSPETGKTDDATLKKANANVVSKEDPEVNAADDSTQRSESNAAVASPQRLESREQPAQALEGKAAGVRTARSGESDPELDEVIVIDYSITKKNNITSKTVSTDRLRRTVIPGNGWNEFEKYIKDSTKINTADSVFTGEEYLSFTISDDGFPDSIKILRSVSPSHDSEVIRLLQNGPSWKVVKGWQREIRLKIIF